MWGLQAAADLKDYVDGKITWNELDRRGLLLSGQPGVGKTLWARAFANTAALPLIATRIAVEIEGTFSNSDIGFLAEGQQANIRLDAYPSERFGFLKARVTDIAADSAEVADKQWSYIVRITPDRAFLAAGDDHYALRPGMTAKIDVVTDERRIISYFLLLSLAQSKMPCESDDGTYLTPWNCVVPGARSYRTVEFKRLDEDFFGEEL